MKPRCPKCNGLFYPEHDYTGRTISVVCLKCGDRHFRDFSRRKPTLDERTIQGRGAHIPQTKNYPMRRA